MTNDSLQCSSDSFPCIVIYILCVENCQNYILNHCGLPIAVRLFYNVREFHGPTIFLTLFCTFGLFRPFTLIFCTSLCLFWQLLFKKKHVSHVTCSMSHITCHQSHVTSHRSRFPCHLKWKTSKKMQL